MCTTRMEWSFSSGTMEVNTGSLCRNGKQPLENSLSTDREKQPTEKDLSSSVFVNHAAIAWQESRRKWVGDQSRRPKRKAKDPILSWSMAYEDLLSTNEPFSEPISLPDNQFTSSQCHIMSFVRVRTCSTRNFAILGLL